jgi:RNA polymerase sigma factor FliA
MPVAAQISEIKLRNCEPAADSESLTQVLPALAVGEARPLEREDLLQAHLPDVRYIARRIHHRLPRHVPLDDLVHAGVIGLIDAADKFDPSKQVHFRTYAKFRIRGAILDSLRELDWSPRSLRKRARRLEVAINELAARLGRVPSESKLADHMGMDLREIQHLVGESRGLDLGSLQSQSGEYEIETDASLYHPSGPDEDPFLLCLRSEFHVLLVEAMSELDERTRRVLALYYHDELTMKEVGAMLGVVESRVSQIHTAALARLRTRVQDMLAGRPRA